MTGSEVQVGLAEYEAAQLQVNATYGAMWQSRAIILGAALAGVAILFNVPSTASTSSAVSVVAVAVVAALEMARYMGRRHRASVEAIFQRMREIEAKTGMRRNIYLEILRQKDRQKALAEWRGVLTDTERADLQSNYKPLPEPSVALLIRGITYIVQASWIFLALWKWLDTYFG